MTDTTDPKTTTDEPEIEKTLEAKILELIPTLPKYTATDWICRELGCSQFKVHDAVLPHLLSGKMVSQSHQMYAWRGGRSLEELILAALPVDGRGVTFLSLLKPTGAAQTAIDFTLRRLVSQGKVLRDAGLYWRSPTVSESETLTQATPDRRS
jgi:hypothetical protein